MNKSLPKLCRVYYSWIWSRYYNIFFYTFKTFNILLQNHMNINFFFAQVSYKIGLDVFFRCSKLDFFAFSKTGDKPMIKNLSYFIESFSYSFFFLYRRILLYHVVLIPYIFFCKLTKQNPPLILRILNKKFEPKYFSYTTWKTAK